MYYSNHFLFGKHFGFLGNRTFPGKNNIDWHYLREIFIDEAMFCFVKF